MFRIDGESGESDCQYRESCEEKIKYNEVLWEAITLKSGGFFLAKNPD